MTLTNNSCALLSNKDIPSIIAPEAPSRSAPAGADPSLDHPENNCNPTKSAPKIRKALRYCPTSPGYFKHWDGRVFLTPCNGWTCPFCAPKKKAKLIERIAHGGMTGGYRWRFLTLTQALNDPTYLMHAWARLRAYLAKKGYHLKYSWCKEFTKAGRRHLHIIINAYIPQKIIKSGWIYATSGYSHIVDIRCKHDIHHIGAYMSKYITKTLTCEHDWYKGERRFGFSRWEGWKIITIPETGWSFVYQPVLRVLDNYIDMTLINDLRARKRSLREHHMAIKNDREFDDALNACIIDAIHRLTGTPIDTIPWDDMGRLILS